jgi:hypothetical protein
MASYPRHHRTNRKQEEPNRASLDSNARTSTTEDRLSSAGAVTKSSSIDHSHFFAEVNQSFVTKLLLKPALVIHIKPTGDTEYRTFDITNGM